MAVGSEKNNSTVGPNKSSVSLHINKNLTSSSILSSVPTGVELFTDPVSAGAIARAAALEAAGGGRGVQRGRRVLLAVARLLQLVDLLLRVVDAINALSLIQLCIT